MSKVTSVVVSSETALVGAVQKAAEQLRASVGPPEEEGGGGGGGQDGKVGTVQPPWVLGPGMEEKEAVLKAQILNISHEKWMFLEPPAAQSLVGFTFDMNAMAPVAEQCLKLDPQLEKMRWLLVPWKVKEEPFWRNYFGRIYMIKNAIVEGKMIPATGEKGAVDNDNNNGSSNKDSNSNEGNGGKKDEVDQLELALKEANVDPNPGEEDADVVALSSMDGLDLEREIAAALNDE